MNAVTYSLSSDRVIFSEAVAFIATVVYPKEKPARAKKIVRDRLFRYRSDGRIPGGRVIPADVFFQSLLNHFPDWHRLQRVQNLPGVQGSFDQAGMSEKAGAGDAITAFVMPGDIAKAQNLIQALQKEIDTRDRRIQELETLVKELEPYRTKDLDTKRKISNKLKGKRRHRD
jgi:hypothetical protein